MNSENMVKGAENAGGELHEVMNPGQQDTLHTLSNPNARRNHGNKNFQARSSGNRIDHDF